MSLTNLISLSQDKALQFKKQEGGQPQAILDISNQLSDRNIAYKIKTTAPKLFVVKPI
jgi:hypothetical protein